MGQATVDLPDPLNSPSSASSPTKASADDLLAQLAGDEIDRLLAEAEVDVKRAPVETPAPPSSPASNASNPTDSPVTITPEEESALSDSEETKPIPPGEAAPASDEPIPDVRELDEALASDAKQLVETPGSAPGAPTVENPQDSASLVAAELDADVRRPVPVEPAPVEIGGNEPNRPLPIILKPLVWFNAPFASLPDGVRDALGKVAILTLFNSIAVLLYVLIFRGG